MSILEAIAKILPVEEVYKDGAQPAVRELGDALGKTIKGARFILAPLEYLAAQHTRWERYLEDVSNRVKPENLTEGQPELVIPILEGLSYSSEDSILTEMFVELLSASVDKSRQSLAHPAFPKIIQQISPDEAVILHKLKAQSYKVKQRSDLDSARNLITRTETISEDFPTSALQYPEHLWLYMDHLHSLNLAGTFQVGNQQPIRAGGRQTGIHITSNRTLMEFGKLFCEACVPDVWPPKNPEAGQADAGKSDPVGS